MFDQAIYSHELHILALTEEIRPYGSLCRFRREVGVDGAARSTLRKGAIVFHRKYRMQLERLEKRYRM